MPVKEAWCHEVGMKMWQIKARWTWFIYFTVLTTSSCTTVIDQIDRIDVHKDIPNRETSGTSGVYDSEIVPKAKLFVFS